MRMYFIFPGLLSDGADEFAVAAASITGYISVGILVVMKFLTLANNVFLELGGSSSENYKCVCSNQAFVFCCYSSISSLASVAV